MYSYFSFNHKIYAYQSIQKNQKSDKNFDFENAQNAHS